MAIGLGILIGLQVVSGIVGHVNARQAAAQQRDFQRRALLSLGESARTQEAALAINEIQVQREIAQQRMAEARASRRARAAAVVEQTETGASGASAARVLDDLLRQESELGTAFGIRAESATLASSSQLAGLRAETLNRQNQLLAPINTPSLLTSVLGIGSNVAQSVVFSNSASAGAAA